MLVKYVVANGEFNSDLKRHNSFFAHEIKRKTFQAVAANQNIPLSNTVVGSVGGWVE